MHYCLHVSAPRVFPALLLDQLVLVSSTASAAEARVPKVKLAAHLQGSANGSGGGGDWRQDVRNESWYRLLLSCF